MRTLVYKKPMLATCILTCLYGSLAVAETAKLPSVNIEGQAPTLQQKNISTEHFANKGSTETGTLLRQINGVNAARMGGHGLEPMIRGQSKAQLNIILDGATIHAGCPNRMDPPTSYSEVNSYDEIIVIKGVASVENGAGGSGGSVIFKRNKPNYNLNKPVSGSASIMKSQVINFDANAELNAVAEQGYLTIQANKKQGNDYKDGNGETSKASFDTSQGHLAAGWTPTDNHHLKVSHEISNTDDAVFPGAGMDSPKSDGTINRIAYEGKKLSADVDAIDFNAYQSTVDHVMNNFALRNPPVMMGNPMKRETLSTTETTGGKLKLTSNLANSKIKYGVQIENINEDATLYNRNNNQSIFLIWPDVTTKTNSLFVEADTDLGGVVLTTGLRYDAVDATAAKANVAPEFAMGKKASFLYNAVYADYNGEDNATEQNVSGLIRATGKVNSLNWFAGFSHTKRTASATERFIAKGGKKGAGANAKQNFWVGNPNIKPEQHNQLDIGLSSDTNIFNWQVSAWVDKVNDYILRDLAKNQYNNGIKASAKELSDVYVNVDAQLYGADASFNWQASADIKLAGQVSYTNGKNTTDDRNIATLPPINGNVASEYYSDTFIVGAKFNFALEQANLDEKYTKIAQYGKTAAWSSIDVYGEVDIAKNWSVKAGVDNLFDHAYYQAINRGSLGKTYKVNEPGRNIWLAISADF